MDIFWTRIVKSLLLPPGGPLLLLLLGLIAFRWRRVALAFLVAGAASLYLASLPVTARLLAATLEPPPLELSEFQPRQGSAIVVLSGGRYADPPEFDGEDRLSAGTLRRIQYGAHLKERLELPLLVSGGSPFGEAVPGAELMRSGLATFFGVEADWVEPESRNTWENARHSARLLEQQGIQRVILVTHAWHMPRAVACFRAQGLEVVPAPTGYLTLSHSARGALAWVPNAEHLFLTRNLLHEWLGRLWYALRYDVPVA